MAGEKPIRFEFATATRIVFGKGSLAEAGPAARSLGQRALIVMGANAERAKPLIERLTAENVAHVLHLFRGEPTLEVVQAGVHLARSERCDLVIGFGGGSAMDAGKAIAALLTNEGDLLYYLEVIGHARPLAHPSAPCITIPTTAGTGAEVTRNAVLASPEHRVKVSLRSPLMLPRLAIVDPELTYPLPPALTASTGMDALTQLIEPYLSSRANPMTDALCVDGMRRAARSLPIAVEQGSDAEAREEMALASLFGGLALANAGLGAVHGFAAVIGGMFPMPHGTVCAALLPWVMETNFHVLRSRGPSTAALRRFDEVARLLTGNLSATAEGGVQWVKDLCHRLKIPRLRDYGITAGDFPAIVEKSTHASSMKANPIVLTHSELETILGRAL